MDLYEELAALIAALNASGAEYALCGGLAVALHGLPRATEDIDLLVPGPEMERIQTAIRPLGYTALALPMTFDAGTSYEREICRISKIVGEDTLSVDFLLVGSTFASVWESRESFEWMGQRVWVVSRSGLARMKRIAGRPQDKVDLDALGLKDE